MLDRTYLHRALDHRNWKRCEIHGRPAVEAVVDGHHVVAIWEHRDVCPNTGATSWCGDGIDKFVASGLDTPTWHPDVRFGRPALTAHVGRARVFLVDLGQTVQGG